MASFPMQGVLSKVYGSQTLSEAPPQRTQNLSETEPLRPVAPLSVAL